MGHQIDQYHSLSCDGRTENLVQPQCTTRSKGGWDYDQMIKEAEKVGWFTKGKGKPAFCPAHAPASPEPEAAEVRTSRRTAAKTDPVPVEPAAWTDQP